MSEWDRIGAEQEAEERDNVFFLPGKGEPPKYMDETPEYDDGREVEVAPLGLIDPATWAGVDAPERRWKVKDYIPDGQATLLTGKGAAGKSLVSQLQATCIAMGLPFLGIEVEQTNALYITCEDDQDELQRRQAAICEGLGITLESLSGKLHLLSLQGELNNELATFSMDGRMSVAPRYRQIQDACARHEIGFLTLDNTAHLFTGNENDRHQVASFINLCNRLAIAISGAVVIVGHPNKAGDSYSGSTAWENQVRSRLFMEIPAGEDGEPADLDLRVLRREKVNYAQRGGELRFRWFKGTFLRDEDLTVNEHADLNLTADDARANGLFLACLAERNRQRRAVSEQRTSRTYAPKEFAGMAEAKGLSVKRLEAAMDRLFRIDAIERGFLWVDKGEGKSRFGIREKSTRQGSADLPPTSADLYRDLTKTNEIKPLTSETEVGGKTNEIKPLTSGAISADLGDSPRGQRKSEQNQSADLSADLGAGGQRKIVENQSADFEKSPPSLQEGIGASPSTGGGGSLPIPPPGGPDEARSDGDDDGYLPMDWGGDE